MFGSSLPPVVCRLMSYLCYLCLFAYSGVQHILSCVFVLFVFVLCLVYPVLQVSLCCPIFIAPSVFAISENCSLDVKQQTMTLSFSMYVENAKYLYNLYNQHYFIHYKISAI
jgi:hypothetical protein